MTNSSCICSSNNESFVLTSTDTNLITACMNSNFDIVQNLQSQDYEAIGDCIPPNQNPYGIRLIFNPDREICRDNNTHPYFWGPGQNAKTCVSGQPLNLPGIAQNKSDCHLVTINPGSFSAIFDSAELSRCNIPRPYVCRPQKFPTNLSACKTLQKATKNSATPTIVGSALGAFVIFVLLLLLVYCFC